MDDMEPRQTGGKSLLQKLQEQENKLQQMVKGQEGKAHLFPNVDLEEVQGWLADLSDKLTWKRWAAVAVGLMVVFLGLCYALFGGDGEVRKLAPDQTIYVSVKPGMNAGMIADSLVERGVLDGKLSFWWQVKTQNLQDKIKTGTYAFKPSMEAEEVLAKLVAGETTVIKLTIPEGFGVKEIAKRLADEGLADEQKFLRAAKDFAPYGYMEKGKHEDVRYTAEGFLFPATYELQPDMDEQAIMAMMAQALDGRLTRKMRARAREMDLSIYELITIASLIEKEALFAEDRPIIAQVFYKRLKRGMPLQTDATLQYLMDAPKEDVSIKDTQIESPYNTYQNKGLPPGPIASPGMDAIEAALYPADTDYLYFVADRSGHNHYSMTYDEHIAIVNEVR